MVDIKINDMDAATAVTDAMQFESDTGGVTAEKVTGLQLANYVKSKLGTASDEDVEAFLAATMLDTDVTLTANSDVKIATQKAVKAYADQLIAAANATVYKGAIDASANPNYPAADAGHLYRISVAGKIGGASGTVVQAGDMIICLTDSTAAGNQATVGSAWNVIQANIDGAVIGPTSSTDSNFAAFDGTTGKLLKNTTYNSSSFATAAQGTLADSAVQDADIAKMVESDTTGITGASVINNIVYISQANYDAIGTPDAATLYVIV